MAMVQQDSSPPPPPHNHLFGFPLPHHHPPFNLQTPRAMTIREHDPDPAPPSASLPQHYARPLPRANSDPFGQLLQPDSRNGARSEHFLRRKTPNGVLHAAYDGTSVEQMARLPAMKHILLPVSEHFPSNLPMPRPSDMAPLRPSPMPFDPAFSYSQQADLPAAEPWKTNLQFGEPAWNQPRAHLQMDSVLNQMPMQSPHPNNYPQNWQVYGYMPQPQQPSFVPTAMGSVGPYPTFWQNANYQQFLPAATQEYSYQQYRTPMFPAQTPDPAENVSSPWLGPSGPLPAITAAAGLQNFQMNQFHLPQLDPLSGAILNNQYPGALDPFSTSTLPVADSQQLHSLSRPADHPSSAPPAPSKPPLALEFGAASPGAKYRERVYQQAVAIYLELIKHLNKHRTYANRNNSLPHRYPKPPKAPIDTHPPPPQHYNSTDMIGTLTRRPSVGHRHSYVEPRAQSGEARLQDHRLVASPWRAEPFDSPMLRSPPADRVRNLRREPADRLCTATSLVPSKDGYPMQNAVTALETLEVLCQESSWRWIDGILLGGSLAYALADYMKASEWYSKILSLDPRHVEALTNQAATLMAIGSKKSAEALWRRAVKLRPGRFEAVEHLIALLCNENRNREAIPVIAFVERSLRCKRPEFSTSLESDVEEMDKPLFDYEDGDVSERREVYGLDQPGFGSSGYAIPGSENNRIHTLVHARGNLLYAAGDTVAAAQAFEEAVLITVGRQFGNIDGLVRHILTVLTREIGAVEPARANQPLLVPPTFALETLKLCFPPDGNLPGLRDLPPNGPGIKSAMSTTSNSLLSLAKIFQDGMASSNPRPMPFSFSFGVREILALYYLSLALQKSPSTANNVGILLAGLHQTTTPKMLPILEKENLPIVPEVVLGTGVSLALAYYNFGLNLDRKHAHLYTNLGSLLKDLGQLGPAIRMYEKAVDCDQKFDIALANLANAVKDQGRIADAITYYQRAVDASPHFAEAVCGLANALNSVCGWQGRGGIADDGGARDPWHVDKDGMLQNASRPGTVSSGWMKRVVDLVDKQLASCEQWGAGVITPQFINSVTCAMAVTVSDRGRKDFAERAAAVSRTLQSWSGQKWEGQRAVRLTERAMKRLTWQWYHDRYVTPRVRPPGAYNRPELPRTLPTPAAPTVLPFHTFTTPMSAKQIRQISQRNGLRISVQTLRSAWMSPTVNPPPPPPNPFLKVGYVSSDFNNHPLAHLMQSVFGMHDRKRVLAHCYATTSSDNSVHRKQIERESPVFHDASSWSAEKLVRKILADGIHILVNLNGYTRGARNEIFAARAAPIQMSFMGFAGTLGAEWCDYLLADETAVPRETLRPWRRNVDIEDLVRVDAAPANEGDWIYGENIIYCRDSFFCCDHRQSAPDARERRDDWEQELLTRWAMRKQMFPQLPDNAVILGNFNQLYKIEPTTFRNWLKILERVPRAVLWLLRFPDLGEQYLRRTARAWSGPDVESRLIFTDVAPKLLHISRARAVDLFLDTPECNAHTTAADVLWSGTPFLTLPRYAYKMCSRMGASILRGALPKVGAGPGQEPDGAEDLIALDDEDYVGKAVLLAGGLRYDGHRPRGRLADLRVALWKGRWASALFDTRRWVADLEEAYGIAWERWVRGQGGDIWLQPR